MERDKTNLKRPVYPIPDYVQLALVSRKLVEKYTSRPPYQQNDYIGWITRAKREATRQYRLQQMLDELESGDKYMNMDYRPGRRQG